MSETVTMTLTEFLLARIAEDEAMARRGQSPPNYDHYGDSAWEESYEMAESEGCSKEGPAFIEHMSPARVLAECEAKRRIVERCHWADGNETAADDWEITTFQADAEGILRALATIYADHPDFNPEWTP